MDTIEKNAIGSITDTINRIIANYNSIPGDDISTIETHDGTLSYELTIKSATIIPGQEELSYATIKLPSTRKINEAIGMEVLKALASIDEDKLDDCIKVGAANITVNDN